MIVAGGMESMSRAPYLLSGARQGWKFGDQQVRDSMLYDGLWCAFEDMAMGAEAEYIAETRGVSRTTRTPLPWRATAGQSPGQARRWMKSCRSR